MYFSNQQFSVVLWCEPFFSHRLPHFTWILGMATFINNMSNLTLSWKWHWTINSNTLHSVEFEGYLATSPHGCDKQTPLSKLAVFGTNMTYTFYDVSRCSEIIHARVRWEETDSNSHYVRKWVFTSCTRCRLAPTCGISRDMVFAVWRFSVTARIAGYTNVVSTEIWH